MVKSKKKNLKEIKINPQSLVIPVILLLIAGFAVWSRSGTLESDVVLDYDPWYHYRLAKTILENNLKTPAWDFQTFAPPGRIFEPQIGWEYTMVLFYKIMKIINPAETLMRAAITAPVIMVGLTVFSAFFLGKYLSNSIGGLFTALFAIGTPTFIGVSMAGYSDTDVVVVFYTFLCIFSILLAVNKKKWPYYIFAIVSNLLFIYNWFFAWYIIGFFTAFIFILLGFRTFEHFIRDKKIDFKKVFEGSKNVIVPLLIIIILTNVIGLAIGLQTMFRFLVLGLGFAGGSEGALVNVSVAELQPISIFTRAGFLTVADRVGMGPTLLFLFGLPLLVFYKLFKKVEIAHSEIFMFMWAAITFWLILHGVRFSLLFSCAVTTAAGYVIGNSTMFLKKGIIPVTFYGLIGVLTLLFISNAVSYALSASGMEVGQNWIDMLEWLKQNADRNSLVATWWDPGHIIAGYTGLKVHADGAHCIEPCYPYNHNVRIQDMGRIMSTSNETEAVRLLKKYMSIDDQACREVEEKNEISLPKGTCGPLSELYFISSNDLIGKYTWMNYFGGYRAPIVDQDSFLRNPGVCCASTPQSEPGQVSCGEFADQGKGVWVWCPWFFSLERTATDQEKNPVFIYDYSGLKMSIIQRTNNLVPVYMNQFVINDIVYFQDGQMKIIDNSNLNTTMEKIDGMVWVDSTLRTLLYFPPEVKDSIFVRTFFFNGEGLQHFTKVYENSEIRIYNVTFD
ncbi:hypothetical protein A3K63_01120 [Candidatus Micrarchaeota archaeon RBG_16_49_10]|nr:MAG: hypothetical protein A3K63_01120 [Candidatus Micrarchaeota archaeon RBG_16_49_10]